jgi:HAD superfamily hydrolase (TIGR01490 family)
MIAALQSRDVNAAGGIGAFFDLDGTLLSKPSLEWRFVAYLVARREVTVIRAIRWLGHWAKSFPRNRDIAAAANKHYLAAVPESLASDWLNSVAPDSIGPLPHGNRQISWHLAQQHHVFVVSGTLAPFARAFAHTLSPKIEVHATELVISDGRWTGELAGDHISGQAKRAVVLELAAKYALDLAASYAYGNEMADLPMLECVGHPCAVNPPAKLRRIAANRNWPIRDWDALPQSHDRRWYRLTTKEAR